MTYEVVDTDTGDVVAGFSSMEQAQSALSTYVEEHPDMVEDMAIASVDDSGHATELLPASKLYEPA